MSIDRALSGSSAKAKGKRPYFLENAQTEQVLTITLALAQEVAVMRERMDTIERLLEHRSVITKDDIETFNPTKAEAAERGLWTQEFLGRVLRIMQQEREGMEAAAKGEMSSESVAVELADS
jgi:hypothetical protein